MQFRVGDKVFHPVHGVGQIATVEMKNFVGNISRLYYQIASEKSTAWIPVEVQETVGLRLLTTKRDLARFRTLLKSRPAPLTNDHGRRRLEIAKRLKEGSLQVMCEAVRDLVARGWHKPLSTTEAASLRNVREAVSQEWAAADGVSITDADREIEALLAHARQAYI